MYFWQKFMDSVNFPSSEMNYNLLGIFKHIDILAGYEKEHNYYKQVKCLRLKVFIFFGPACTLMVGPYVRGPALTNVCIFIESAHWADSI